MASGRPGRPTNACWLWLAENLEDIQKELGVRWQALPAAQKAQFKRAAEKTRDAYDLYEKALAEWKEQQGNKENEDDNDEDEGDEVEE